MGVDLCTGRDRGLCVGVVGVDVMGVVVMVLSMMMFAQMRRKKKGPRSLREAEAEGLVSYDDVPVCL